MTPRQRLIIAALALANTIVILTLVVLVTHPSGSLPSPLPTPTLRAEPQDEASVPGATSQEVCQWQVTQLLAQSGLGGTVTLTPGGPLRFEIVYPRTPGQTVSEAAQAVWTAFDVALALQGDECGSFTQVEVTILAQGNQTDTQISASVSAADLAAFSAGELSEDEFIERVAYTTTPLP